METYCVSCNKNTANENSRVRKTKQNRFYQIVLFLARKNQLLLKIKNSIKQYSTILIKFELISLK